MRRHILAWDMFAHPEYCDSMDSYEPNRPTFVEVVRPLVPDNWILKRRGPWAGWAPVFNATIPPQGWKIHVSSTEENAASTLRAVAAICVDHNATFKHLIDDGVLQMINGKGAPRSQGGKFITIYPPDKRSFRVLLKVLANATAHWVGPLILSDRRYSGSSVVQYRYGGIRPISRVDVTGQEVTYLVSPENGLVPDERQPYFTLPEWISDESASDPAPAPGNQDVNPSGSVTLRDGRYTVEEAFQFSNIGGVYQGRNNQDGSIVVLKEARPHLCAMTPSLDSVGGLRREWETLCALKTLGIAPHPIEFFCEWEHWFLVETLAEGLTLGQHSARHSIAMRTRASQEERKAFWKEYCSLFSELAIMLQKLHDTGFVFGDLSPNNVIVRREGERPIFIDLETAFPIDHPNGDRSFTHGYVPRAGGQVEKASKERDRYALGAMLLAYILPGSHVVTYFPERLQGLIEHGRRDFGIPATVATVLSGLLQPTPITRMLAGEAADILVSSSQKVKSRGRQRNRAATPTKAKAIAGGLRWIRTVSAYHRTDRLIPAHPEVFRTNPLCVAYGACGVAIAMKRITGDCPQAMFDWIAERKLDESNCGPGLYTGLAGIAWSMAGIGCRERAHEVFQLAVNHKSMGGSCDLFNGMSGVGLTALEMYRRTSRQEYLNLAQRFATEVVRRAKNDARGMYWLGTDGLTYSGLAYGASGVALFLLYLYKATGEERWLEAGRKALDFELATARNHEDERLVWSHEVEKPGPKMPYWEFGAAGIGTVILRYCLVCDSPEYWDALWEITKSVCYKYTVFPGYFMGLAGIGQFLLDVALLVGDRAALQNVRRISDGLRLVALPKDGGYAFTGETFGRLSGDFGTGAAGVLLFLDNIAKRRTSVFMPDAFLTTSSVARGGTG